MGATHIRVTAVGPDGEEDDTAVAIIGDDGVIIDSPFLGTVGLSWDSLHELLKTPEIENRLLETDSLHF